MTDDQIRQEGENRMDFKEIFRSVPQATEQLPRGAFLTAGGEVWNPMTIGWAQFGVVWAQARRHRDGAKEPLYLWR